MTRVRPILLAAVLMAGAVAMLFTGHAHYPLQAWLFWRFAGYALLTLGWLAACLLGGHAVVARLTPGLPLWERASVSLAVGVYLFALAIELVGFVGLLGAGSFVALPLLFLAAGTPAARRLWRQLRRRRLPWRAPTTVESAWWGLGLLVLGLIYFAILSPENIAFDARWKHLALAEQYAAVGAVYRFPEGWYVASFPHLASLIYTWAFTLPVGGLFDRVELAAHMELGVFVASALALGPAVARLVPRPRPRGVWVVRLLFPGVLLYDASLSGGADHFAAFFTLPAWLLLLRAWPGRWRPALLAALCFSGALWCKYSVAFMVVAAPGVVFVGACAWRGLRARRLRRWLSPAAALVLGGLLFTAPHWLKNLVWYGDPAYPILYRHAGARPWSPEAAQVFEFGYKGQAWKPARSWSGLAETAWATITVGFVAHDWVRFHGKIPVFGFLFTLMLPALLFLRRTRRLWGLVALIHLGVAAWYWTHHQDRYLQALMPWMAAVTAAVMVRLWRQPGWWVRGSLVLLVALQVVWGGDVYFMGAHAMSGGPLKATGALLGAGAKGAREARFEIYGDVPKVGAALPTGATLLVHEIHPQLGFGARLVHDWDGWQGGLYYSQYGSPAALWARLRGWGVTHLTWTRGKSRGWHSVGSDLRFFYFARRVGVEARTIGRFTLARLPMESPTVAWPQRIAVLGCGRRYRSGTYPLEALSVPRFGPQARIFPAPAQAAPAHGAAWLTGHGAVVVERGCRLPSPARQGFKRVAAGKIFSYWLPR